LEKGLQYFEICNADLVQCLTRFDESEYYSQGHDQYIAEDPIDSEQIQKTGSSNQSEVNKKRALTIIKFIFRAN